MFLYCLDSSKIKGFFSNINIYPTFFISPFSSCTEFLIVIILFESSKEVFFKKINQIQEYEENVLLNSERNTRIDKEKEVVCISHTKNGQMSLLL